MSRGKAAGLDGLTTEHLQHCHQLLPCVLAKLFNLIMDYSYTPKGFCMSYTVPIPKDKSCGKSLTTNDFRGISISPILSKVFEHSILDRYKSYFCIADNQFGFKKSSNCAQAIYSARSIVNYYACRSSTVNLCALDISKAFDRVSHCGLFIKLMCRSIPINLLLVLEDWFNKCYTLS